VSSSGLRRIVFKRILDGDVRKLRAESNDRPNEGGGARDFRFNPWTTFEPVFARMFPKIDTRTSKRGKSGARQDVDVDVRVGDLHWWDADSNQPKSHEIEIWPPTAARNFEGRISQVHKLPPFDPSKLPSPTDGEVFLLLWEDANGVWGCWATESSLKQDDWNQQMAKLMLGALDEARRREAESKAGTPQNVRGFIDFVLPEQKVIVGGSEWL
jgi:hypothetical protein